MGACLTDLSHHGIQSFNVLQVLGFACELQLEPFGFVVVVKGASCIAIFLKLSIYSADSNLIDSIVPVSLGQVLLKLYESSEEVFQLMTIHLLYSWNDARMECYAITFAKLSLSPMQVFVIVIVR